LLLWCIRVTGFVGRQRHRGGEFEEGKNDLQKCRAIMALEYVQEVVATTVVWKKIAQALPLSLHKSMLFFFYLVLQQN